MKNSDSLDRWYKSALDYKRTRREANAEFGGRGEKSSRQDREEITRKEKVALAVPRQDPEAMDIDRMKRQVSQKVTYLFCDELGYRFKSL